MAFNEEDLASSDFQNDEDWMKKIEAEWQHHEINRLSNFRSEEGLMATEALGKEVAFGGTLKGPLLSHQTADRLAQQKIKTQDVSEILRRAKQEFISRETAADPYEEDCVVRETDPDEKTFPKHEPNNAQLSSIGKNKPSNLSQHTQSTVQQPGALSTQKSPSNRA